MTEEQLAAYFEARRGDTSEWSEKPVKATVGKTGDGNWPPIQSEGTPLKVTWWERVNP